MLVPVLSSVDASSKMGDAHAGDRTGDFRFCFFRSGLGGLGRDLSSGTPPMAVVNKALIKRKKIHKTIHMYLHTGGSVKPSENAVMTMAQTHINGDSFACTNSRCA